MHLRIEKITDSVKQLNKGDKRGACKGVNNPLCLGHPQSTVLPRTLQVEQRGHQMRLNGRGPKSVAGMLIFIVSGCPPLYLCVITTSIGLCW